MFKKLLVLGMLLLLTFVYAEQTELETISVEEEEQDEIEKLRHSPMPVSVIDVTRFHGRNISLNEVLKRVAGVKIKQQGGLGSRATIAIHGLDGNRVKIYIDGSPLNSPDGTFGINDIPIQFIERIEVYKGVVPAKFGGDSTGGAVNVVIKEFKGNYIDATYSVGSYGEHRGTFVLQKELKEYNLELSLGGFYNKAANDYIMKSPFVEDLEIKRDHAAFESLAVAQVGKIKDVWFDKISWELVYYESEKEIQGILSRVKEAKNKSTAYIAAIKFEKDNFFIDNLEFEYTAAYIDLELNHIDKASTCYNFDGSERKCPGSGGGEITGTPHDSEDKQKDFRHDLNLYYSLNKNHAINFHVNMQNSEYAPKDELADAYAGFETSMYPSEKTNTVSSLGWESSYLDGKLVNDMGIKNYDYDYKITPRVIPGAIPPDENHQKGNEFGFYESIRYEPIKGLFIKSSYEHALRLPNSSEVFGNGGFIGPANNLAPEIADNFNFGVLFDSFDFYGFSWVKLEANFFYKNLKDMIKLEYGFNKAAYVNLGKVEVKGFELEFNIDIDDNWYVYGNYTNQTLLDKLKLTPGTISTPNPTYDHDLPNVPKQYANAGLEYKTFNLFQADSTLKLFWEVNWADEYFYGWELSRHQSRKIESQLTHTAGFEYNLEDSRYVLGFEVRNLTDQEITDVFNYPLAGRTYHFNLRYTWF